MKIRAFLAAALLALLALTGCATSDPGGSDTSGGSGSGTIVSDDSYTTHEQALLVQAHTDPNLSHLSGWTDSQVLAVAKLTCDNFDRDKTFASVVTEMSLGTSIPMMEAAYFAGASIGTYCPQYAYLLAS